MTNPQSPDIWVLLANAPRAKAPTVGGDTSAAKGPPTFWSRLASRARWLLLDALGFVVWAYALLQLFAFDVDRTLVRAIAAPSWLLDYKFLTLPVLALVASIGYWRWWGLAAVLYVLFFPGVVLLWKIPRYVVVAKIYENLLVSMAIINGIAVFGRNLRYNLFSKSAGTLATVAILVSTRKSVLVPAAATLLLLFLWSVVRVVGQTFRSSFFVEAQRGLIRLLSRFIESGLQIDQSLVNSGALTIEQCNAITNQIGKEVIVNRALYAWSYKLHQYRKSNMSVVLNGLSYLSLFLGAAVVFFLVNLAVLKCAPEQFRFASRPSIVAMALYGLSTLALAEGGGVASVGDVAFGLRILAGLFGPAFLLTTVANFVLTFRGSRTDVELDEMVQELRRRAKRQEVTFQQAMSVNIAEACERLAGLGSGLFVLIARWMVGDVPPDYFEDDE